VGSSFWLQVLAEALASLPVFVIGLWFSHRRLRRHVDNVTRAQTWDIKDITRQQTGVIEGITDEQTAQLESGRRA
jgi:hypothetical protein